MRKTVNVYNSSLNAFRYLNLPSDASDREIAARIDTLRAAAAARAHKTVDGPRGSVTVYPSIHDLEAARARIRRADLRLIDTMTWFRSTKAGSASYLDTGTCISFITERVAPACIRADEKQGCVTVCGAALRSLFFDNPGIKPNLNDAMLSEAQALEFCEKQVYARLSEAHSADKSVRICRSPVFEPDRSPEIVGPTSTRFLHGLKNLLANLCAPRPSDTAAFLSILALCTAMWLVSTSIMDEGPPLRSLQRTSPPGAALNVPPPVEREGVAVRFNYAPSKNPQYADRPSGFAILSTDKPTIASHKEDTYVRTR